MAVSYHSKKKSRARKQALETAKSPLCRVICSAQALTTGYNLPSIDAAICASSTSVVRTLIQELGRTIRIKEGKQKPIFITLYSANTQEQSWVDSKSESFKVQEISSVSQIKG